MNFDSKDIYHVVDTFAELTNRTGWRGSVLKSSLLGQCLSLSHRQAVKIGGTKLYSAMKIAFMRSLPTCSNFLALSHQKKSWRVVTKQQTEKSNTPDSLQPQETLFDS